MRRPQTTWRGFTERGVEPVVLPSQYSPLHLPSPKVGEYGARGLGSVLFVYVFHLERVGETQPCILGPVCGYIQFTINLRG